MGKFKLTKALIDKIDKILDNHENNQTNLLAILLEVQSLIPNNYIPKEVGKYISLRLQIPSSKVYDVITFFSALNDKPKGRHIIQLCKSTTCRLNNYQTVRDVLEKELGISIGEVTEDGEFSLEYTACFGACDISPAFRIDDNVFGNLNENTIIEIINSYRGASHG